MSYLLIQNPTLIKKSELKNNKEFILTILPKLDSEEGEVNLLFQNFTQALQNDQVFLLQCIEANPYLTLSLPIEKFKDTTILDKIKTLIQTNTLDGFDLCEALEKKEDRDSVAQIFVDFLNQDIIQASDISYEMRFHPLLNSYYPNHQKMIRHLLEIDENSITYEWFNIIENKYEKELPDIDKKFLKHLMLDFEKNQENSIFTEYFKGKHFYTDLKEVNSIIDSLYSCELTWDNIQHVMHSSNESSFIARLEESDFIFWRKGAFTLHMSDNTFIGAARHLHELAHIYFERSGINFPEKIAKYIDFCEQIGLEFNCEQIESNYS